MKGFFYIWLFSPKIYILQKFYSKGVFVFVNVYFVLIKQGVTECDVFNKLLHIQAD